MKAIAGLKQQAIVLGILCGAAGLACTAGATVIYDSNGFDNTSRFSSTFVNANEPTVGNLRGQDSGVLPWLYGGPNTAGSTTGSAKVITSASGPVQSASQAVQVDRFSADNRWAPNVTFTPSGSNNVAQVTWDMNVTLTGAANKFGPFMGIEAYGNGTTGSRRLGGAGVDATTGEFLYETPTTFAAVNVDSGTHLGFQPGAGYHHYELDFDYGSQTYSAKVDGVTEISGATFINTGKTQFTDADISTLQAAPTGSDSATGTAYFDNYAVNSVPEPTSGVVLMAIGLLGLRRRARGR